MRFIKLSAGAFGAIRNGSLVFAPRFNLIYGPNEAGKSTWHTALYAAFCGMRRGRGQSRADQDFIRQHRPWDGSDQWEVSVVFSLEDGRTIELRQELIGRVDCHAIDVDLGRECSNEIINEGSLDGSMWLGLDRQSFIATACIKQTQLLEVLNNPAVLQTHLQRAAATFATSSTAAAALQLIETFRAEHVGQDRSNSTKPFRRAVQRIEAARDSLETAKREHAHYLDLIALENQSNLKLDSSKRELNLARAVIADRDAIDWERRLQHVEEILSRHPERPSANLDQLEELVRHVSTVLNTWQERPAISEILGSTAAEIEAELQRLPLWPEGDLEPDANVSKAAADFSAGKHALSHHAQTEPLQPVFPDTGGFSVEQLRQFASVLLEPEPQIDPHLEEVCRNTPIDENLIRDVHTAIQIWEHRPALADISVPTAEDLRREIQNLPAPPEGDLEPTAETLNAANGYSSASEALRQHRLNQPPDLVIPDTAGTTPTDLRSLAFRLREPRPKPNHQIESRHQALMNDVQQLAKRRSQWIAAIAGASVLLVALLLILVDANRFVLAGIGSLAGFVLLWFVARLNKAPIVEKQAELKNIEAELNEHLFRTNEWNRSQRDVRQHLEKLRLPTTPEALDALAAGLVSAQDAQRLYNLWAETYKRLEEAFQNAGHKLSSLLTNKLRQDITQVENALKAYYEACAERSRLAALANRKADLEMQLAAKLEAEAVAAEINQRVKSAELELRRIADLCGVAAESDEMRVLQLREWLSNRERVKVLQKDLSQQVLKKKEWDHRQRGFREQLQVRGLVADATVLRRLADDLEQAYLAKAGYEPWSATFVSLTEDYKLRADRLRRLLETKGVKTLEDLEEALQVYRRDCGDRSRLAALANRKVDLEMQLAVKIEAEAAAAKINQRLWSAESELRRITGLCGVGAESDEARVVQLREWLSKCEQVKVLQRDLSQQVFKKEGWDQRQKGFREQLQARGLVVDALVLRRLADDLEQARLAKARYGHWSVTFVSLTEDYKLRADRLRRLLETKGVKTLEDLEEALQVYRKECEARSRVAAEAKRRQDLERQLVARQQAEAAAAEINQRLWSAELELQRIADLCGVTAESDEARVLQLREWLSNRERVKVLQRDLSQQVFKKKEWDQRQGGFQGQLQTRGLVMDVMGLRRLADDLEQAYLAKAGYEPWSATLASLTEDYKLRADRLRRLLETKGVRTLEDLEEALQVYQKECEARSRVAAEAKRRQDLERQLAARQQAEDAAAEIYARRERARQDLRGAAERCGILLEEDALLAERLKEWLTRTSQTIRVQQEALKEWREIDTLLDGKTVEDLRAKVQLHRRTVLDLASDFSPDEFRTALPNVARYEANVADLTKQVEAAALELANIRGQIYKYQERLTPVSDAEEELKTAEEELAKIRLLDDTLQATQMFLTQAQERVHRDIAPFLAQAVKRWLPEVTLERYVDARVDPETLQVRVCDRNGKWREAALLSHGTAEQIYLLLRLALVQYLTKPSEICPLILDDVTVQSDATRKERILRTLKTISESRQMIFFTQEEEVLAWAKDNLTEPENRIVELASAVL